MRFLGSCSLAADNDRLLPVIEHTDRLRAPVVRYASFFEVLTFGDLDIQSSEWKLVQRLLIPWERL